ncbi:hypothetical protein Ssi03_77010 [Sphaerisporangium siamense]|uniref:Uncharacterized protein n=1 Tax=Sphaerisporangium siamense TaxID=795645 RepID=A0A7W7GGK4_9ACTN|nr:hypothetical protein [Sphaerisporangium siamense]MBB4706151.1 hypothetical protein [Sphaerisporangium siamense]GII89711.1 hypothetical protein Ssi03_77010 [Sphaerisporangium siamense]
MPKTTSDPHGYDQRSDTVRVRRHDVERLLLMFRQLAADHYGHPEHAPGDRWAHMADYDISFERLADEIDAANRVFYGRKWTGPDYRMRCDASPAYDWPAGAPYDGGEPAAVRVVEDRTDHGTHYVPAPMDRFPETLCGFGFAPQEGRPAEGEADCTPCRRELALLRHLQATAAGPALR